MMAIHIIHFTLALPVVFAVRQLQNDAGQGSSKNGDLNLDSSTHLSRLRNWTNGSQLENAEPPPPARPTLKGPLLTLNGKTDLKFQFKFQWSSIPVTSWHDLTIDGYVTSIVKLLQERPEMPLTCPEASVGEHVYLILREKLRFTEILHSKVFTAVSGVAGTGIGGGARSALQGVLTKLIAGFKLSVNPAAMESAVKTTYHHSQLLKMHWKIGKMVNQQISKDSATALLFSFVTYSLVYEEATGKPWSLDGKGNAFDWILSQVQTMTRLYHWLSWTERSVRLTLKNRYGGFEYGGKYYYDLKMKCMKSAPGAKFKAFVAFENDEGLIEQVTAKHLAVYILALS